MISFAEKKRLLVAESDTLREEISLQLDALEESLEWVEHGIRTGRAIQKGAPLLGVVGTLFLAWRAFHKEKKKMTASARGGTAQPSLLSRWITHGIQLTNLVSPFLSMFRTKG